MIQIQENIKKCIAEIIQQNSVVQNIFDEIKKQGGKVLLVGGAVRDCLLNKHSSDLDFEIYHLSLHDLQKILEQFGVVSFVGKSFGVLRLHGLDIDLSIPRKDSVGRKPIVSIDPNMSYIDAFRRRDITINAMGIDVHSLEIIDPYGGCQDLQQGVLRAPDVDFFVHDPLRLFRVMQFIGRFNMYPDNTLNDVCKNMDITNVSVERIDLEFEKLFLKSQQPSKGLRWLQTIGWFEKLFPNIINIDQMFVELDCLAQKTMLKREDKLAAMWGVFGYHLDKIDLQKNTGINMFALDVKKSDVFKDEKVALKKFIKSYVHSSKIIRKAFAVAWYLYYIPMLSAEKNLVFYKWLAYCIYPDSTLEFLSMVGGCIFDANMIEDFITKSQEAGVLQGPLKPLLEGKDLLPYAQGKELGDLLKKAYEMQLHEDIQDPKILMGKLFNF